MKPSTGGMLAHLLERRGWVLLKIRGSHNIYGKQGCRERISIPMHGEKPLKTGLLIKFSKIAEIERSEIE
jgi:predicted RNA binding protein YcfA (HicA-like mRNA interferase family)